MKTEARRDERGFRALLVLGAVVSVATAVWGLVWTDMLENVLGFQVPNRALGLARAFGGIMLAVGIGYALAAAQPHRSRSLLVPLFVVPAITAVTVVAGVARGEISGGQGVVYAIYNAAYCLLYFRMYPRVPDTPATASTPPAHPPQHRPPDQPPGTSVST